MRRSIVGIMLVLVLGCLVTLHVAEAQGPVKVHRIGILGSASITNEAFGLDALRQGLHELGYVEGQNLTLEYRSPEGKAERLADLAAELVGLQVEVLVAAGTPALLAAQHATTTLPIVIAANGDPVEQGIVASLARPGGNTTGSFFSAGELQAKRLELLKEAVPGVHGWPSSWMRPIPSPRRGSSQPWSPSPRPWG